MKLQNPHEASWSFQVEAVTADTLQMDQIPAITISQLLAMSGEQRIGLLKIDIEGAEREVFAADSDEWLEKTDAMIIELHDWHKPGCSEAFMAAIRRHPALRIEHHSLNNVFLLRS